MAGVISSDGNVFFFHNPPEEPVTSCRSVPHGDFRFSNATALLACLDERLLVAGSSEGF